QTNEPPYPVWGYGIGYGALQTILDFEQGSRVLDAYQPYSIFLPTNRMQMAIHKMIIDPEDGAIGVQANVLWMSIRAPMEIEQFALFKIQVVGNAKADPNSDDGYPFVISFSPVGFCARTGVDSVKEDQFDLADEHNFPQNPCVVSMPTPYTIHVDIGRNFQDGSWHTLNENLLSIVRKAATIDGDPVKSVTVTGIEVIGNQYRLDNIWLLRDYSPIEGEPPYFFKIGHQFIQLFQPFEYYCYAKDPDLSYRVFLDIWQNEYEMTGEDPNFDYVKDLTAQHMASGPGQSSEDDGAHDGHLADPDDVDPARDRLFWTATVGAWGAHGTGANFISEIPIANNEDPDGEPFCDANLINRPQLLLNPYKPCMVDLPTPYDPDNIEEYDPETIPHLAPGTGGVRIYSPKAVAAYGNYLLELGFKTWPQMARLFFVPQVLENLIITVRVQDSNGRTDLETFPLMVVSYPMTNHPPKMENVDEQAVQVGQTYRYQMVATDQDWEYRDQLNLTWRATISGLPSYRYGPWQDSLINPLTGSVTFTPQFEGLHIIVVQVTDARGLSAIAEFEFLSTSPGGWFNHRPYIMGDFNDAAPLVIKAGQLFILGPPMLDFHDPDGDELYYSCNIGSVAIAKDGDGTPRAYWTFQTNFPGFYWVQITAFDIRGGWVTSEFPIDVQPWWSM
ncbi:MAG: hypothetical protein ACMUIA_08375, partial [bacterium]